MVAVVGSPSWAGAGFAETAPLADPSLALSWAHRRPHARQPQYPFPVQLVCNPHPLEGAGSVGLWGLAQWLGHLRKDGGPGRLRCQQGARVGNRDGYKQESNTSNKLEGKKARGRGGQGLHSHHCLLRNAVQFFLSRALGKGEGVHTRGPVCLWAPFAHFHGRKGSPWDGSLSGPSGQ